uniref:Uncharacterized protein n=1 Tax=Anguilla anguilla TaxID=7936 RepID=A0A0E9QGI2_ANGAN
MCLKRNPKYFTFH